MTQRNDNLNELAKVADEILAALDARSKDIITRRYGLKSGSVETLESIGQEYGVTRERVRQIQAQAKRIITDLTATIQPVKYILEEVFSEYGGLIGESHIITVVQKRFSDDLPHATLINFYLDILPPYQYYNRHTHFEPHWRHPDIASDKSENIVSAAQKVLNKAKHPMASNDFFSELYQALAATTDTLPREHIEAALTASKSILSTPFGEWGLAMWSETNPHGVGDKSYAVMRRHGKPEHFTRIAELINEASFDNKNANPQTVHNELIKDKRFVLVGRGLYGLAEWGYIPGTVADVIETLLKKAGQPLAKEEIIKQVLAQRQVKKNTIVLGLQNPDRFTKNSDNLYSVREKK